MDVLNDSGLRNIQKIVGPFEVLLPLFESLTTECRLIQLALLDHGPHGPIEDKNALLEQRLYLRILRYLRGQRNVLLRINMACSRSYWKHYEPASRLQLP